MFLFVEAYNAKRYRTGGHRHTRELFTHMETSTLPVKGCNF